MSALFLGMPDRARKDPPGITTMVASMHAGGEVHEVSHKLPRRGLGFRVQGLGFRVLWCRGLLHRRGIGVNIASNSQYQPCRHDACNAQAWDITDVRLASASR